MSAFRTLSIPKAVYDAMVAQALAEAPAECCGELAGVIDGDVGRVTWRYPLINRVAHPHRYEVEPRELFATQKDRRTRGLEMLAIYHSHPTSEPVPSKTDLAEWFQGECAVCVIVSLTTSPPTVRVWWLMETGYREAEWEVASS